MNDPLDDPLWWSRRYSDVEPAGHRLRKAFPDRWFRIHSLPEGKRCPENEEEWQVLLGRHRAVSSIVLGDSASCQLITPFCCAPDDCYAGFHPEPAKALPEYCPEEGMAPTGPYFSRRFRWGFDRFEPVLRAVSTWDTLAIVVSEERPAIYAPYDGGADLILPDSAERDRLKLMFHDFLSHLPSGL